MLEKIEAHAAQYGAKVFQIKEVFKIKFTTYFKTSSSELYLHSRHGLCRIQSMIDAHAKCLAEREAEDSVIFGERGGE